MSEWQPIETAPVNVPVLVAVPAAAKSVVGEAMLHDHGDGLEWWWANEYREYHADEIFPTHWQPLPEPPQ